MNADAVFEILHQRFPLQLEIAVLTARLAELEAAPEPQDDPEEGSS